MLFKKVKDHNDLIRDSNTRAILNINKTELEKHKLIQKKQYENITKINNIDTRMLLVEEKLDKLLNILNNNKE